MKKPPDKDKSPYQSIKVSLSSVIKHQDTIKPITDAVITANKIVIHTLQFIKLYIIHCTDNNLDIPVIDRTFVTSVMKVLCNTPSQGRPPSKQVKELKEKLQTFSNMHYEPLKNETLSYRYLNTVLDYLAIDIITMYENNIKLHYVDYVERYVNVVWKKKELTALIRKKYSKDKKKRDSAVSHLWNQLRKIKTDLLDINEPNKSEPIYHDWIEEQQKLIVPNRQIKKGIYYDIQCSPQDYLPCMIYMMKQVESTGSKVFNVCSLRSECIPKHIRIDTTTLVQLLVTKKQGNKSDYLTQGNLVKNQDKLWKFFFRTEKKCFHLSDGHSHTFHHMIETDGVSCCILLIRKDLIGKKKVTATKTDSSEQYIDELTDYTELQNKTVVGIDPNLSDLIFCISGTHRTNLKKFRYTQDTRRKETKSKKYRDILQEKKKTQLQGKSISEWEAELSNFNRKTLDFQGFQNYIQKKNEINLIVSDFYSNYLFRKLRLGSYMRRQITEARMLRKFEKQFGKPSNVVIGIGDYEQRQHRKFKEPIKGKGFRTLFRKAGYPVYLVDEFRTSCRCTVCEGSCSTFRKCENPRPFRTGEILRHGLLKCGTCSRLWNRDVNASLNILKVAKEAISGNSRPSYLCRTFSSFSNVKPTGLCTVIKSV